MAVTTIRVADGVSEQKNSSGDTWYGVTLDSVQSILTSNIPSNAVITNARLIVEAHYTGALNLAKIYVYAGWGTSTSNISKQYINGDKITTTATNYYSGYILSSIFSVTTYPFTLNRQGCSYLTVHLDTANVTARKHFIDDVYIEVTYDIPSYTITANASPIVGGTVKGGGTYQRGSTATLTATASTGYVFTGWSDGNTASSRSITVNSNGTYTAYFKARKIYVGNKQATIYVGNKPVKAVYIGNTLIYEN